MINWHHLITLGLLLMPLLQAIEVPIVPDINYLHQSKDMVNNALLNKQPVPSEKELADLRDYLVKIAFHMTPATQNDRKILNLAKYMLAFMMINGLGGPLYPDDAVTMLEEILNSYSHNPNDFDDYLQENFLKKGIAHLTHAIEFHVVDNWYAARLTLAHFLMKRGLPEDIENAIIALNDIIMPLPEKEIDIALINRAKIDLADIYLRLLKNPTNHQKWEGYSNAQFVKNYYEHNRSGVYEDDYQKALQFLDAI